MAKILVALIAYEHQVLRVRLLANHARALVIVAVFILVEFVEVLAPFRLVQVQVERLLASFVSAALQIDGPNILELPAAERALSLVLLSPLFDAVDARLVLARVDFTDRLEPLQLIHADGALILTLLLCLLQPLHPELLRRGPNRRGQLLG